MTEYTELQIIKHSLERYIERPDASKEDIAREKQVLERVKGKVERLKERYRIKPVRYFLIIGERINYPMGCCNTNGLDYVHAEEPEAKFYEITREEFHNFENTKYASKDWLSESKSYSELTN